MMAGSQAKKNEDHPSSDYPVFLKDTKTSLAFHLKKLFACMGFLLQLPCHLGGGGGASCEARREFNY
jgi:hypothetical protein